MVNMMATIIPITTATANEIPTAAPTLVELWCSSSPPLPKGIQL